MGIWKNELMPSNKAATESFEQRVAVFYARRAGRETGELLVGALDHEDPRAYLSGETTFKKRLKFALGSVVLTRTDDGSRLALAPIAGSLGSAFAGAAVSDLHSSPGYAARSAGITYGMYFVRSCLREFQPDLSVAARHLLHRRNTN